MSTTTGARTDDQRSAPASDVPGAQHPSQQNSAPGGTALIAEPDYEQEWEVSEDRQTALRGRTWMVVVGSVMTIGGGAITLWSFTDRNAPWWLSFAIGLAIGGPFVLIGGLMNVNSTKRVFIAKRRELYTMRQIVTELDVAPGEPPMSTLLAVNRQEMKLYHVLTLEQARRSFKHAQIAFFLGFAVVVACIAIAVVPAIPTGTKLIVGAVGVVSTVLSGYITATFSRSHAVSLEQLNRFFVQPVTTSYLLTAERVALKLEGDQKSQALQKIVTQALRSAAPEGALSSQGFPAAAQKKAAQPRRSSASVPAEHIQETDQQ